MVVLLTSDNEQFIVDKDVAERSAMIKATLDVNGESDQPIPLHNVSSRILKKILEYCEYHKEEPLPAPNDESQDGTSNPRRARTTEISEWDQKFMAVDQEMVFDIILGANYLEIKPLVSVLLDRTPDMPDIITSDLGCQTVANMIKGKTPEEIRKAFRIVNEFTPEEEAQISKEIELQDD